MATEDLITTAEAKQLVDMSGTGEDTNLTAIITAVSFLLEEETNMSGSLTKAAFVKRAFTEYHTGAPPGATKLGGARRIYLGRVPIVSITSISDEEGDVVSPEDYTIAFDEGFLEHDAFWPAPFGRWKIDYRAGHFDATANVPEDLKLAAKMMVKKRMDDRKPGVASASKSGRAGSRSIANRSDAAGSIPEEVRALLRRYAI